MLSKDVTSANSLNLFKKTKRYWFKKWKVMSRIINEITFFLKNKHFLSLKLVSGWQLDYSALISQDQCNLELSNLVGGLPDKYLFTVDIYSCLIVVLVKELSYPHVLLAHFNKARLVDLACRTKSHNNNVATLNRASVETI